MDRDIGVNGYGHLLAADDAGPVTLWERQAVERLLGPEVEVPPPIPVAKVRHVAFPADLGLWRGYHELLWTRPSACGLHRLPDYYGGIFFYGWIVWTLEVGR